MHAHSQHSYLSSDREFDNLFPVHLQSLSGVHWTPLHVAEVAARFLAPAESDRVIDIGAGVGKFCMAGSIYSQGTYTGIEQVKNFVTIGNKLIRQLGLQRVSLVCGNFTDLDLNAYNSIYFYNSFHENLVFSGETFHKIGRSDELYDSYTAHLLDRLIAMPAGTRLATYWLSVAEVPGCYMLQRSHFDDRLKLWVRKN